MKPTASPILHQWLNGIRIEQIAHLQVAARYERLHRAFGLLVTTLAVGIGTSIFGTLATSESRAVLITVGVVSMISAVLSGLQTFLNYGDLATKHQAAGSNFGKLRRHVEEMIETEPGSGDQQVALKEIREEWDRLADESPMVPQAYVDKTVRMVTQGHIKDNPTD